MTITVLTLFPDMIRAIARESILGRALKAGLFRLEVVDIRDFSGNRYGKVDDALFGGGTGMLMMCQPVYDAHQKALQDGPSPARTIYLSPKGAPLTQGKVEALSGESHLVLLCGHYEGIDQRVLDAVADEEISIGDYVLTGGELAAMVVVDAVARRIPGVLPDAAAYENESHADGLLEHPQYTRPSEWMGRSVPPVLLSGHHARIVEWKRRMSLVETLRKRPDLLTSASLSEDDLLALEEEIRMGGSSPK